MQQLKYYPRLDGIRGVAALLVVLCHWTRRHYDGNLDQLGVIGVYIFFVLSGFLITRILLEAKEKNLATGKSNFFTIRNFIARRALRIFPIYYLAVLVIFGFPDFFNLQKQDNLLYYLTYTSNFHYYFLDGPRSILGVSWTLAIEEQFYLIFPWFIFLLSRKGVKYFIIFLIFIGILFYPQLAKFCLKKWMLYDLISYVKALSMLTPSAFDSLGIGAMFAYTIVYSRNRV